VKAGVAEEARTVARQPRRLPVCLQREVCNYGGSTLGGGTPGLKTAGSLRQLASFIRHRSVQR